MAHGPASLRVPAISNRQTVQGMRGRTYNDCAANFIREDMGRAKPVSLAWVSEPAARPGKLTCNWACRTCYNRNKGREIGV